MSYTMGSLFAGIGGFDLGFTRAGFDVTWEVEIDPYCQKVLAKNFPEAERFGDIRECGSHNLKPVDVICGGFPCQDISNAGRKAGIDGKRSGLWAEMLRIVCELRPKLVLIENVSALVAFGLERVLCDLAANGFDAEWEVISAAAVGAGHLRERIWILAYPMCEGQQGHIPWEGVLESNKSPFAKHSNAGFDHWKGLEDFAAGLPEIDGLSVGLVRRCVQGLGNAVVPQIPEMIATRIKQALEAA